jgi:hypothetical protein
MTQPRGIRLACSFCYKECPSGHAENSFGGVSMMKRSLPVLIIASAVLLLASAVHAGPPSQFVSVD